MGKAVLGALSAAALLTLAPSAKADLVTNGGFEQTTNGAGQLGFNTNATGWSMPSSPSYTFLFTPGGADTTGSIGEYGLVKLWGPGDGSNNGLPATSPEGGNYIGSDGDFQQGAVSQTINGLTAGDSYTVSFWWAGAQQDGFTGANTEGWIVSLGSGPSQETSIASNSSEGFTGWVYQSFTFKADSTSDVLSFMAVGTPNGVPPFSLLDGVSMVAAATPEPAAFTLMGTMLVGLAFARKQQLKKRS